MNHSKPLVVFTSILLVGSTAIGAGASNISWNEEDGVLAWETALGLDPGILREYRPQPLYTDDDPATDTKYGSMFYLGGQEVFAGQGSWAARIPDEGGDSEVCDWSSENWADINQADCFEELYSEDDSQPAQTIRISANLPVCELLPDGAEAQPCIESVLDLGELTPESLSPTRYVDSSLGNYYKLHIQEQEGLTDESSLADPPSFAGRAVTKYVDDPTWVANPALGIPTGAAASLWQSSTDTPNEGMFVRATLSVLAYPDGTISFQGIDTQVVKYLEVETNITDYLTGWNPGLDGVFYPPAVATVKAVQEVCNEADPDCISPSLESSYNDFPFFGSSPMASFNNPGSQKLGSCAYEELLQTDSTLVTRCGLALTFEPTDRFSVNLKVPDAIGGWFHGRLGNANMVLEATDEQFGPYGLSRLTVSGEPVDVPITGVQFEVCGPAESVYSQYYQDEYCDGFDSGLVGLTQWSPDSTTAVADFTAFEPLMFPDKSDVSRAKGSVNLWSFGTMFPSIQGELQGCLFDATGIQGMIATNAMVYQAGLPILNGSSFDYQVASTSEDVMGLPVVGDYTLVMRSDIASCIYDLGGTALTSENTSFTVKDGETARVPTDFSASFENVQGWMTFKVSNFGFSSPTIGIAIDQQGNNSGRPSSSVTVTKPELTSKPTLSGVPKVGTVLSTSQGTWNTQANVTYSYQWYRCANGFAATKKLSAKSDCKAISGATSNTYTPKKKDSKFLLSAEVTATNSAGSSRAYTAAAPFGVKRLLDYTRAPKIQEPVAVKSLATASIGRWNLKNSQVQVSWLSCERASAASELGRPESCKSTGTVGRKYLVAKADLGKHLVARIAVTKGKQVVVYFTASIAPKAR